MKSKSRASSSRVGGGNQMSNLINRLKEHKNKKARSDSSLSFEYERYVYSDFITHLQYSEFTGFDVLGFWNAKESMFPVLSRMTMDLISVQATSVASESAFSTSGMERKQHTYTLENALDIEDEIFDAEVQENEATPLSVDDIALDAASQGTMASGSGGEEQNFDYDLTNYGIDD
nr:zinc finger BED domain-containing protein RICESLEEPER 2-like [Tanacetum cinerariifolium]